MWIRSIGFRGCGRLRVIYLGGRINKECRKGGKGMGQWVFGLVDWWIGGLEDWWIGGLEDWWADPIRSLRSPGCAGNGWGIFSEFTPGGVRCADFPGGIVLRPFGGIGLR
jgi:hypothetical protein